MVHTHTYNIHPDGQGPHMMLFSHCTLIVPSIEEQFTLYTHITCTGTMNACIQRFQHCRLCSSVFNCSIFIAFATRDMSSNFSFSLFCVFFFFFFCLFLMYSFRDRFPRFVFHKSDDTALLCRLDDINLKLLLLYFSISFVYKWHCSLPIMSKKFLHQTKNLY